MRIAVDVDNTLAATLDAVVERYNAEEGAALRAEQFDAWDFRENPLSYQRYETLADAVWADGGPAPTEPGVGAGVRALGRYGDVDIVTGREGREPEMRGWLRGQGIRQGHAYGAFVVEQDKAALDYDLYVDDNPMLAALAPTVAYPQRYNVDVDALGRTAWDGRPGVDAVVADYVADA